MYINREKEKKEFKENCIKNPKLKLQHYIDVKKIVKKRVKKYKNQWDNHSLKKTIKDLLPNAIQNPVNDNGKIIFTENNKKVQIVYDLFGNYFRVQKVNSDNSRNSYLNIEGKECQNKLTEKETWMGKSHAEFNRDTHYKNTDNMKHWRR